ncbi:MAG TPA: ketoacyl-ACP synthase III [Candidatus Nanoarchaeia archaeon]
MKTQLPVEIVSTGFSVPEDVRTNPDILKMFPGQFQGGVQQILRLTGIRTRHIANDNVTSAELGTEAARQALKTAGVNPKDVGILKVARTIPDNETLATACLVQHQLGLGDIGASDTVAACAGTIYALEEVACQMTARGTRYGLVIGTEIITRLVGSMEPDTAVLFGDAGGAILLRLTEKPKLWITALGSDGKHSGALSKPFGSPRVVFHGNTIYKQATRTLPDKIRSVLNEAGLESKDVARWIFHQANLRIIESVCRRLGLCGRGENPPKNVVINISSYGNTSTASMIIALCEEMRRNPIERGERVVFASFGAGLSSGVILLEF